MADCSVIRQDDSPSHPSRDPLKPEHNNFSAPTTKSMTNSQVKDSNLNSIYLTTKHLNKSSNSSEATTHASNINLQACIGRMLQKKLSGKTFSSPDSAAFQPNQWKLRKKAEGSYGFNATPIALSGTKCCACKTKWDASWGYHFLEAWYVPPSLTHYCCFEVIMAGTGGQWWPDIVCLENHAITIPNMTNVNWIIKADKHP